MKLETFKYRMKHERCMWDVTENVYLSVEKRKVELWNYKTDEVKTFKTIDDLLDVEVEGKKMRDYIEELDDFPPLILDDVSFAM